MSKNCGKSEAIRMGMLWSNKNLFSEFESIGYIDSDGAFNKNDIEHFNLLLDKNEITAVQVVFNRPYKDYTDAQTNDDTYKLLQSYVKNKKKYNFI